MQQLNILCFLLLTSELLKNSITFNVPWSIKTCHYYFFNSSMNKPVSDSPAVFSLASR